MFARTFVLDCSRIYVRLGPNSCTPRGRRSIFNGNMVLAIIACSVVMY